MTGAIAPLHVDCDKAWDAYRRNPTPDLMRAYSTIADLRVWADENKVRTHNEYPPIPLRQFDWCATTDDYEPGQLIGWGATEADAVRELRALLAEQVEA